jgi:lipooligosaccharide transport system permease protein
VPIALLGGLFFSSLGLIATALVPTIDSFNVTTFLVIFPMFLFSGTFLPVEVLPGWAAAIALVLPLTHVSSLVRGTCLGETPAHWIASLAYLVALMVAGAALAIPLMRRRLIK